jgi:hypothetical protein
MYTQDESVAFVSVADGSTPRTAATVAYLTKWQCHSVDPQLKKTGFEVQLPLYSYSSFLGLTLIGWPRARYHVIL